MTNYFILAAMVFAHIIADYNLQGWLASAKQKSWWKANAPEPKYKHDYIMALLMHSICWSFMVLLPLVIYYNFECTAVYASVLILNILIHMIVDDMKANAKIINLCTDQSAHMIQIIFTFLYVMPLGHF